MFWFINNEMSDLEFYQVFTNYEKYKCNSTCYDFNTESIYNLDLSKYKRTTIVCDILLKGSIIQYNNENNKFTFLFQEDFIKENKENILNLPMLYFKYKITDNYKLPLLNKNNYDFYFENIKFNIYNISNDTLLIEQIFNNKTKSFFISKNILEIKTLLN